MTSEDKRTLADDQSSLPSIKQRNVAPQTATEAASRSLPHTAPASSCQVAIPDPSIRSKSLKPKLKLQTDFLRPPTTATEEDRESCLPLQRHRVTWSFQYASELSPERGVAKRGFGEDPSDSCPPSALPPPSLSEALPEQSLARPSTRRTRRISDAPTISELSTPARRCGSCHKKKPQSAFNPRRHTCEACLTISRRTQQRNRERAQTESSGVPKPRKRKESVDDGVPKKRCSRCRCVKPLAMFEGEKKLCLVCLIRVAETNRERAVRREAMREMEAEERERHGRHSESEVGKSELGPEGA